MIICLINIGIKPKKEITDFLESLVDEKQKNIESRMVTRENFCKRVKKNLLDYKRDYKFVESYITSEATKNDELNMKHHKRM